MTKNIKIVIGSNYGDESKGLMVRHFCLNAKDEPIVIFHNGTAQRGHTIDYTSKKKHVYHHFGCGTADGIPTFFADSFFVHPMEFVRENFELKKQGILPPLCYCDPDALVITPFDMYADQVTETWLARQYGQREFGSCCYGTWCATDRRPHHVYRVNDFYYGNRESKIEILKNVTQDCIRLLESRQVDFESINSKFFDIHSVYWKNIVNNFLSDLIIFFNCNILVYFNYIYNHFNTLIFENGQGLGLDQNVDNEWHTTSNTGIQNPYRMLKDREDFKAEVCYVSRSYLTRHGFGPMEDEDANMKFEDRTNHPNDFQGVLRFGHLSQDTFDRIDKDFSTVAEDHRFNKTIALTHANEYYNSDLLNQATYTSYDKYTVN